MLVINHIWDIWIEILDFGVNFILDMSRRQSWTLVEKYTKNDVFRLQRWLISQIEHEIGFEIFFKCQIQDVNHKTCIFSAKKWKKWIFTM